MNVFPLGRIRSHDERNRSYALSPRRVTRLYPVTHYLGAPHMSQGTLGACEGFTAAEWLNSGRALRNRRIFHRATDPFLNGNQRMKYLSNATAIALYAKATELDQFNGTYPPTDTGSSGLGIAKAMKYYGAINEYRWTFTWDDFLSALQSQPVMLGMDWYDSMFNHDSRGIVGEPSQSDSAVGGHAVLAYAYRPKSGLVGCTNHWGVEWGTRIGYAYGSFWINQDLLRWLLIDQRGESLVPTLIS